MNEHSRLTLARRHVNDFWPDRKADLFTWNLGPIREVLPDFAVCRLTPRIAGESWAYVSIGASDVEMEPDYSVEFVLLAPDENARHIETLAIVAHYHATSPVKLDVGHIVNVGRPWLGTSICEHLLVSLPYPFGPNLEWCRPSSAKAIRFLWLLPITASEAAHARSFGLESLEQRFDELAIDAIDVQRSSAV
jgi:hypothetical protein